MRNDSQKIVLQLKKSQKEYIERAAEQKHLSIEQFLVLCVLAFGKDSKNIDYILK